MRGPKPTPVTLTEVERQELEHLAKRHTTPQRIALRARLILAAAQGLNNARVARQEAVSVDSARRGRTRWLGLRPIALGDPSVQERLAEMPHARASPPRSPMNSSARSWRWWPAKRLGKPDVL